MKRKQYNAPTIRVSNMGDIEGLCAGSLDIDPNPKKDEHVDPEDPDQGAAAKPNHIFDTGWE